MSDLLSALQKNQAAQLMDDLHDTFKQTITIINERANVVVNESDENYNAFSDEKQSNITYTSETQDIYARVKWIDKSDKQYALIFAGGGGDKSGGTSTPLTQDYGVVRIKVENQYTDLVQNSTKIIVSDQECQLFLNYTPQDLFDRNYTVFYLTRQK